MPFLCSEIKNYESTAICSTALDIVDYLFTYAGFEYLPHFDEIMMALMEAFNHPLMPLFVKVKILHLFSYIVLDDEDEFKKYRPAVLATWVQATQFQIDVNDQQNLNYLHLSLIRTFNYIFIGFQGDNLNLIQPYIPYVVELIMKIIQDPQLCTDLVKSCAEVIAQLCDDFGSSVVPLLDNEVTVNFA